MSRSERFSLPASNRHEAVGGNGEPPPAGGSRLRGPFVLFAAICYLLLGSIWTGTAALLSRRLGQAAFTRWSRGALWLLGVRWRVHGEPQSGVLLAPNHRSWVDILALQAVVPTVFLSKHEVRNWPVVGWVAAALGTVFIGGPYGGADRVAEGLESSLARGRSVVVFPEGQLNQEVGILPFISRLFRIAQKADTFVQPVAIAYKARSGGRTGLGDLVPERSFLRSAWWLAGHGVDLEIHFLEPIRAREWSRRELAEQARGQVAQVIGAELSNRKQPRR